MDNKNLYMHNRARVILQCAFLLFLFAGQLIAQTDSIEKKQPKMKFGYIKNNDGSKTLICEMNVRIEKERFKIKDLPINFSFSGADSTINLGTVKTDNKGIAVFKIGSNQNLTPDKEGFYIFKAVFDGSSAFESAEEELKVKDINISLSFTEDSIKYININAFELINGEETPVEGPTVNLYVQRSLGLLKIKNQTLTSGTAQFEFPSDLPGDSVGNLTLIVKIEEDENFGTVEKSEVKKWGIPFLVEAKKKARELWSPDAPLWMSVTLLILIFAVVIHYLIIFYKLYAINKEGKELNVKKGN
ncbi:MAG: hypothetical protein U0W24_15985 [Bacteroidales bacterium]